MESGEPIHGFGVDVDPQEDMLTLEAIRTAVPLEIASVIADKDTAKEAWNPSPP